jgi:hypothetical protein
MSVTPAEITLPSGRLSLAGDGSASVLLRLSLRNRDALLAAVDAASRLDPHRFWACAGSREDEEGLRLDYAKPPGEVTPLTQLVGRWRTEPAAALPRALELARLLLHVTGELDQARPSRFLLSPAQIFAVRGEGRKERWLALPLPLAQTTFADFVRADEDCWAWLSADEMLSDSRPDRAYTVGATLHYCLVGPLYRAEVSRAERVRRLVMYRAGSPQQTRAALSAALPESEGAAAARLCEFITGLLSPPLGRALTARQAFRELDHFCEELSAERLTLLWEAAGDEHRYVERARGLVETLVATASDSEVPWDTVERLRDKAGDRVGAAEAAARRPRMTEDSSVIDYARELLDAGEAGLAELERLTDMAGEAAAVPPRPSAETAVVRADPAEEQKPGGARQLSEEEYLYLTYVRGRRLGRADEALLWLRRDFAISWNKVVRSLLSARLCAEKGDWVRTAGHCKEGREHVTRMPDSGGTHGRYAAAYLDLLDGIAHVCAVRRQGRAQEYLGDAFDRLQSAWVGLQQVDEPDAEEAVTGWLSLLGEMAGRNPQLAMLGLGVGAFLESRGVRGRVSGDPPLPWFDESRIFAA